MSVPDTSIIAGRNPVREALERGEASVEKVLLQRGTGGKPVDAIRRAATDAGVPVQYVPQAKLDRLAPGVNHQGVVAVAAPVAYREVYEALAEVAPTRDDVVERKPIVLVLDGIEDPHNFGAILRSAVAMGVGAVIVPKHGMAPLNATTVKASAGGALRIPVARATNIAETLQALKERGYWVAGAAGEGAASMWEIDWDRPMAIVIGNESKGLRRHVADTCDYLVAIPMRGPMESLNASVATGILLSAAVKVRL